MERKTTTTTKEIVRITDTYYTMSLSKTNGKIKSIGINGNINTKERLLYLSEGFSKSKYSLQAKVEELRDLLNTALKELLEDL